jgi:hypothetical protein
VSCGIARDDNTEATRCVFLLWLENHGHKLILCFEVLWMAHSENGRGHEHHGDFRSNIGDKIEKMLLKWRLCQTRCINWGIYNRVDLKTKFFFATTIE